MLLIFDSLLTTNTVTQMVTTGIITVTHIYLGHHYHYTTTMLRLQETKHLIPNSHSVVRYIAELKEFQWLSTTGLS